MTDFTYSGDPENTLIEWSKALKSLDLSNFSGTIWRGQIAAGKEQGIFHGLRVIPRYFLVIDASGVNTIVRGASRWDVNYAFVKNFHATDTFLGSILILR